MNILFILPEFYPVTTGGISTYYQNLLPALVRNGCMITVIHGSATYNGNGKLNYEGIEVYDMSTQLFLKYQLLFEKFAIFPEIRNHLAAAWAMYEQAKSLGTHDIVEAVDFGWGYLPWALNGSGNLFVTFHASIGEIGYYDPVPGKELEQDIARLIEIASLKYVANLNTYGKSTRDSWQNRLNKPMGLQLPAFSFNQNQNVSHSSSDVQFALIVGRIQYWKGPSILCEALKLLNQDVPNIIWLGGDKPYQNGSMDRYLSDNFPGIWRKLITPLQPLNKSETISYQLNADFIIIPSIWDVFNFTCIEAMALGKVVICSEKAGASVLIENGVNGFTYSNNSPLELASVIKKVCSLSNQEKQLIGSRAKSTIDDLMNPDRIAHQRLNWYKAGLVNEPVVANAWIKEWLTPQQEQNSTETILNNLPLKQIMKHTWKRIRQKVI